MVHVPVMLLYQKCKVTYFPPCPGWGVEDWSVDRRGWCRKYGPMDSSFLLHILPFPKMQAVLFTQIISVFSWGHENILRVYDSPNIDVTFE